MQTKNRGFKRMYKAVFYSYRGFMQAVQHEAAFQQEALSALILIPAACLLGVTMIERILLIVTVFLVLIVELLNTGLEAVVDRIGSEYHELSKQAKDIGSAAVLLSLILWAFVWSAILFF